MSVSQLLVAVDNPKSSLACSCFTLISVFTWLFPPLGLCVTKTLVIGFRAHPNDHILRFLITSVKTPFLSKVTFTDLGGGNILVDIIWEGYHHSSPHGYKSGSKKT